MKQKRATVEGTDPNLTGQAMLTNQMQPKGIIQGTEGKTVVKFKKQISGEVDKVGEVIEVPLSEQLTLSSGALIRKEISTVSGSEAINKYYVFLQSKNGLKLVFKSEPAGNKINTKGLKMNIKHIRSEKEEMTNLCPVYARVNFCTGFCCFCPRWEINVEPHQSFIGVIKEISEIGCEIYDDRKNELYKIENLTILKNNQEVGTINKKKISIGNNTPAETYELSFPSEATNDSKILLIFATMLIDLKNLEYESK